MATMTYGWAGGSSRRWRKLCAQKLTNEPTCEPCLAEGRISAALEVHHKHPIGDGGDP